MDLTIEKRERIINLLASEYIVPDEYIDCVKETDHAKKCEQDCFLIYERIYHNKNRIFLLNLKDRYFIVLEERPSYYLLITAYYIDFDKTLERKIEEYNKYKTT